MITIRIRAALAAMALLAMAACGGGSAGDPVSAGAGVQPTAANTGSALVTLTDAPGDFLSYSVGVVSVELKRADGTLVETLPAATQVDFAQLVDFSEILSATQVPAGVYVGASLTLDYANALIVVDNGNGGLPVSSENISNSVTDAPLVGANSRLTLAVQLPTGRPLVITRGMVGHLALDFDLAASNTVLPAAPDAGTTAGNVKVKVNPVLLAADIVPDPAKELRLRGTLVSVTNTPPEAMSYTVNVAPFNLHGDASHGEATVKITDSTSFSINGVTTNGTTGLARLAILPAGSMTLAQGTFDRNARMYTATNVIAGSSLPLAGFDLLQGTVIARSANVLTVAGALSLSDFNDPGHDFVRNISGGNASPGLQPGDGMGHRKQDGSDDDGWRFAFTRQVPVTVGAETKVTRAGRAAPGTAQEISVGQRVAFYGKLGQDTGGNRTFDASQGGARLLPSGLWGNFQSQDAGVFKLSLRQLDGRPPAAYDFAGTGTTSASDADPAAYTVAVPAALGPGTPAAGTPMRFLGFVAPFGSAPPAFNAVTMVSFESTAARVELDWMYPGVTAPFAQADGARLVISQGTLQSAREAGLYIGPQRLDLAGSVQGITFLPDPAPSFSAFAIIHRKTARVTAYDTFGNLVPAVIAALNGTTGLFRIHAEGPYDSGSGSVSVNRMVVVVDD